MDTPPVLEPAGCEGWQLPPCPPTGWSGWRAPAPWSFWSWSFFWHSCTFTKNESIAMSSLCWTIFRGHCSTEPLKRTWQLMIKTYRRSMYRKTQSPLVTPLASKPLLWRHQQFPIRKDLMKIGKIALMMDTSGVKQIMSLLGLYHYWFGMSTIWFSVP